MGGSITSRYRIEYDVQDVGPILAKNQQAIQAHGQALGGAFGVDPQQSQASQRAMIAQYTQLQRLTRAYSAHGAQARTTTRNVQQHTESVSNAAQQFQYWGLALRRMMLWWGSAALMIGMQKVVRNTLEIAGAFQYLVKELTVIGSEGESVYKKLAMLGYRAAIQTGRAFDEAADAMRAWIRQGYSATEVAELTRTTLMGLNLTEMSSIELVRTMTAVMKAFNIPADESVGIIDKLMGVSRKFAIETSQLATGLRRFAASAEAANVTLEQQMGIMTAMMVGTQQSAQMVGRAGRTITTRMRRHAVEALETIAKVEVYTDKTRQTYRDLWDILSDLAATWGTLTDVEKEEIAFQAAGLRQREFFLVLMRDFDVAQKAHIEALASAGLAYKSNLILMNSYQKAVAQLRAEWERILSMQSGLLDFFTNIAKGLRQMVQGLMAIPEAVYVASAALASIAGGLLTVWGQPLFGVPLLAGGLLGLGAWELGTAKRDIKEITEQYKQLVQAQYQVAESTGELAREFINLFEQQEKGRENTEALTLARKKLHELNPELISEEESFAQIYGTLTSNMDYLAEATRNAFNERKKLLIFEKERELLEARKRIREEETKERYPYTPAPRLITQPMGPPVWYPGLPSPEGYETFMIEHNREQIIAYMKEINELDQMIFDAEQGIASASRSTLKDAEKRINFLELQIAKLDEENQKYQTTINKREEILRLEKELASLRAAVMPEKGAEGERQAPERDFNEERYKGQQKIITDQLDKQRALLEAQFAFDEAILGIERSRSQLAADMYAETVNWLWLQFEAAQTMERQVAIMGKIIEYGPQSVKWYQMLLNIFKGINREENQAFKAVQEQAEKDAERHERNIARIKEIQQARAEAMVEEGDKLDEIYKLRLDKNALLAEQERSLVSTRIRNTEGAIAAAMYEYEMAQKDYIIALDLEKSHKRDLEVRKAKLAVLDKELAIRRAILDAEQKVTDIVKERKESELNYQERITQMKEGDVAAAEMVWKRRREELSKIEAEYEGYYGPLDFDQQARLEIARTAEATAWQKLVLADLAKSIDLGKEYDRIMKERQAVERQIKYEEIEREHGRAAAIREAIRDVQMEIDILKYSNVTKEEGLEILKKENELLKLRSLLIAESARKEESFIQTMQKSLPQLITHGGQFLAGALREERMPSSAEWGVFGTGIGAIISSEYGHFGIAAVFQALGSIIQAFSDREEENTDSLDLNTIALDRNTETLNDIREAVIGDIRGRFIWPAAVEHYGYPSLQGGGQVVSAGLAYVHPGEVRQPGPTHLQVIVNGAGQDAEQVAQRVIQEIDRRYDIDKRRGFSASVFGMPR